ncbi:MAG: TIGR01777 family oxidoreductase [Deltaproteobacteria bacterium]|nr:TIGR01777 family oxidoreductase [Deltaproteobacteria bacterium]
MRIFITGGTGFIGRTLTKALVREGHDVTVLTRTPGAPSGTGRGLSFLAGDPLGQGEWQSAVADHDVVINLAGASIFGRWTKERRKAIRESRLLTTGRIVEALSGDRGRVRRLLSASAVGFYGFCGDAELDEQGPPGEGFLASLTRDWEAAARDAEAFGVSVALLRFGVVLGRDGGALKQMIPPFRWYLGSPMGSGRQWFSWIHEKDLVEIFLFLLGRENIAGPLNCTAPHPVRNEEMTTTLGDVLGKPTFMPAVPGFVLRILMGKFAETLLKGQRVLPGRLRDSGFGFRFPELNAALKDLLK